VDDLSVFDVGDDLSNLNTKPFEEGGMMWTSLTRVKFLTIMKFIFKMKWKPKTQYKA